MKGTHANENLIQTVGCLLIAFGACLAETGNPLLLQKPTVNRTDVVFSYAGDLWIVSREGGDARRLTTGIGVETNPLFSPDGTEIALTGEYDGNIDVYVVAADGGVPRRLTSHPGPDKVVPFLSKPSTNSYLYRRRILKKVAFFLLGDDAGDRRVHGRSKRKTGVASARPLTRLLSWRKDGWRDSGRGGRATGREGRRCCDTYFMTTVEQVDGMRKVVGNRGNKQERQSKRWVIPTGKSLCLLRVSSCHYYRLPSAPAPCSSGKSRLDSLSN